MKKILLICCIFLNACESTSSNSLTASAPVEKVTPGVRREVQVELMVVSKGRGQDEVERFFYTNPVIQDCFLQHFKLSAMNDMDFRMDGTVGSSGALKINKAEAERPVPLLTSCLTLEVPKLKLGPGKKGSWHVHYRSPPLEVGKGGPRFEVNVGEKSLKIQQ